MKLEKFLKEIEKMKKEIQILEIKRLELLEETQNTSGNELNEKIKLINEMSQKIAKIKQKTKEKRDYCDSLISENFEEIDIKIFVLRRYRKITYAKIAEILNYSDKQIMRRYRKILDFEMQENYLCAPLKIEGRGGVD